MSSMGRETKSDECERHCRINAKVKMILFREICVFACNIRRRHGILTSNITEKIIQNACIYHRRRHRRRQRRWRQQHYRRRRCWLLIWLHSYYSSFHSFHSFPLSLRHIHTMKLMCFRILQLKTKWSNKRFLFVWNFVSIN